MIIVNLGVGSGHAEGRHVHADLDLLLVLLLGGGRDCVQLRTSVLLLRRHLHWERGGDGRWGR